MAVRVAKRYHQQRLNFCIITFYDQQSDAITKALKAGNLPSGCVYNVDSFQGLFHSSRVASTSLKFRPPSGNEADYVILFSVKTQKPGFLKSLPRMNVALTRCRKGNGHCHQQGLFTRTGEIYPARGFPKSRERRSSFRGCCAPTSKDTRVPRQNDRRHSTSYGTVLKSRNDHRNVPSVTHRFI